MLLGLARTTCEPFLHLFSVNSDGSYISLLHCLQFLKALALVLTPVQYTSNKVYLTAAIAALSPKPGQLHCILQYLDTDLCAGEEWRGDRSFYIDGSLALS